MRRSVKFPVQPFGFDGVADASEASQSWLVFCLYSAGTIYKRRSAYFRQPPRFATALCTSPFTTIVRSDKDTKELRRAILEVVWNCPNIVTQI